MGRSTNGMLVYGFDLGGSDDEWKIREVDEYGGLELPWLNSEDEDDDGFQGTAEKMLLADVGFTEEWSEGAGARGYFDREKEAKSRVGVEFDTYSSGDYPQYVLAAKVVTVYGGEVGMLDMVEMVEAPAANDWDAKLAHALSVLGITPTQEKAAWFVCSYWG